MEQKFGMKQWIFFALSIALILIGKLAAPVSVLSAAGNTSLFFMLAIVVLLVSQTLSAGVIAIFGIICIPLLKLTPTLNDAAKLFGSQLFFFILACFAISTIMGKLPLSKRLLYFFLKTFNKSTKQSIIAMLLTTALLSTFISNFPCAILMYSIIKPFIDMIENEAERKQTAKTLIIGIIISVAIGGFCTPIGNSCMALASSTLTQVGFGISFVQWMSFGVPIAIVLFPITIFVLFKLLPPVEQSVEVRNAFINKLKAEIPNKFSIQEILTVLILGVTVVCWILNFNLMIVTVLCGLALIFPGFKLLTWKEFNDNTGWGTILMVCSILAVVSTLQSTGVITALMNVFKTALPVGVSPMLLLIIFGVFVSLMLILMPNGPVLVAVLATTIISLAQVIGIHPGVFLVGYAYFTTCSFLVPVDAITMVLFNNGANFSSKDYIKVGLPITIVIIILIAVWMPICGKILGLI